MNHNDGISCLSLENNNDEVLLSPLEYSKILDIQQNIFELLTVGHNEKIVLSRLCEMAEKLLPNSVASVMLVDPNTGLMNVISAPSIPQIGHDALRELAPGPGGGSCGNAVFRNEPQYVRDTKTDERWSNLRQIAYDFNLCSCWSMPIRNEWKQPIGSFALSSFEHRSPSGFHKRLLEICAFIVNIVLKRSEYETRLDANQKKLNILGTAIKHASDGMVVTDKENKIIEVNNAFIETFGYTEKEVLGKNPKILASGKHDKEFYQEMWNAIIREKHWSGEILNKRANGEIFHEWMSISAISDDRGEIQNYLTVFTDLSELRENQKKLVTLAYYDQLTDLPNRQKINMDMDTHYPYACAIFNLDDFKEINDFFGISAGDSILAQIGDWFREIGFSPYRIGGDEFAILFYDEMTPAELYTRIKAILSLLEEKVFIIENETLSLQMTAGAAIGEGKLLLTRADIALHQGKEKKLPIAFYKEQENIEEAYRNNISMAASIRNALANRRIVCHYQPIFNLQTGNIDKYETLVRIIDEKGEMIPPVEFLSIAKKTKLYPQITHEVVYQACALFAARHEDFSLNLSASDMRNPHTVAEIIDTITHTGTASRIVFEILESEGIESFDEVERFITQVKALGAKIAIDDFGTGYSNFENILKLGVDYIKIDGSLIRGITTNTRHQIIIDTIVDFAGKIGAKTIAEFVSDESIHQAVIKHGIDYSQGFYIGKPDVLS